MSKSANLSKHISVKRTQKQCKQIKHFCQHPNCNLYAEHVAVQGEFSGRPHIFLCTGHLFVFRGMPANGQDKIDWQPDRVVVIQVSYSSYGTNRYA